MQDMIILGKSLIQNKNDKCASFNWKPQNSYFNTNFWEMIPWDWFNQKYQTKMLVKVDQLVNPIPLVWIDLLLWLSQNEIAKSASC